MDQPKLISIKDVCARTSLSRTAINRHRSAGDFPKAVILGQKRVTFVASEIDAWINARIASRDGEAA
ncbi:helix-turn-helix transcriptional regulator [Ahrensia marina]|uniref:Uncharacterized protein n=1 Tax=Ahrensia marina TaxID=1514904 RepID=A0A0N0VLT4_9HYPH|nr:AlpA family phage regulatory protein [Ahrensia marina]KPB01374.1 hypothetical protein SU32_08995 [Ahrensia marina]